jgi:hypothetical protein
MAGLREKIFTEEFFDEGFVRRARRKDSGQAGMTETAYAHREPGRGDKNSSRSDALS